MSSHMHMHVRIKSEWMYRRIVLHTILEYENKVAVDDSGYAVRDGDDRAIICLMFNGALNEIVGHSVYRGSSFVQHENLPLH